jgi:hypothetical protein
LGEVVVVEEQVSRKRKVSKYRTTRSRILEIGDWRLLGFQEDKKAKGSMNGPNKKKLLRVQCVAFHRPLFMVCSKCEVEVEAAVDVAL